MSFVQTCTCQYEVSQCTENQLKCFLLAIRTFFLHAFQMTSDTQEASVHRQILQEFEFLQRCTQETENDLRQLQQKQESLIIHYQEIQTVNSECSESASLAQLNWRSGRFCILPANLFCKKFGIKLENVEKRAAEKLVQGNPFFYECDFRNDGSGMNKARNYLATKAKSLVIRCGGRDALVRWVGGGDRLLHILGFMAGDWGKQALCVEPPAMYSALYGGSTFCANVLSGRK